MAPEDLHQSNYAALYQIIGHLAGEAGVFGTEEVERLLTDLQAMVEGAQIDLEVVMDLWAGNDQVARHECPQAVPVRRV